MNANGINARRAANEFVNAPTHRVNTVDKHGNEMSCPAWGLDMAEAIAADRRAEFPNDTTEIVATGATEYANGTTEFSELSHAGQCLDIYLHNDSFIYEDYTQKAIEAIVNDGLSISSEDVRKYVKGAIYRASWQVEEYDHLTPTAQDVEQVTRNYVAYIVDCAK